MKPLITLALLSVLTLSATHAGAETSKTDILNQKKTLQEAIQKDRQQIETLRQEVGKYEVQLKDLNLQLRTLSQANIDAKKAHQLEVKTQRETRQEAKTEAKKN